MSKTNGQPKSAPAPQQQLGELRKRYSPEQWDQFLELAHNALTIRQDYMKSLSDPRRDIEDSCGYPRLTESVSPDLYKQLYNRDPIAARIVDVLPMESWQTHPTVYETEDPEDVTEFEEAWDELGNNLASGGSTWFKMEEGSIVWDYLRRVDILSGIGKFGVLFLGIDDGKNPSEPADGVVVTNRRVEPVYRDVPIRNAQNEIVGTRKLQIGMRVHNEYGPLAADSPMTENEEKALTSPTPCRVWNGEFSGKNRVMVEKAPPALSEMEQQIVKRWQEERKQYLVNRETKLKPEPTGRAKTSDGRSIEQLTGTDREYSDGLGLGLPSLSGTDAQYYGVQFGLSEELSEKPSKEQRKLLFIRCFDESLVQVVRYEWNINSPRFGQPVMYRITLNDPNEVQTGIGLPLATIFVHWSRIVHVADIATAASTSENFAKPRMQQLLNPVLGLRKLHCGSPEMYWRGAFPGLALYTNPQLGGDVTVDMDTTRDNMENYFNDLQRYLMLTGMQAQMLSPTVSDPSPHIERQIELICIKLGVPKRIFMGSERGELASSQDDSQWNDIKRSRQLFYLTPRIIVPFVDRCIQLGLLPEPESYFVQWPALDTLSETEKATVTKTQVETMQMFVEGNLQTILSVEDFWIMMGKTQEEAEQLFEKARKEAEETPITPPQPENPDGGGFGGQNGGNSPSDEEDTGKSTDRESESESENTDEDTKDETDDETTTNTTDLSPEEEVKKAVLTDSGIVTENAFCPTGKGGGVDPTCSPKKGMGGGDFRVSFGDVSKLRIKGETKSAQPKKVYSPNVEETHPETGVTIAARVGVPASSTPPPPPIGKLPNLTPHERRVEKAFIDRFHKDPEKMSSDFRNEVLTTAAKKGEPPTFGTDDAKVLSSAWHHENLSDRSINRATLNVALHQTANAIAKRAFVQHLDTLKPGDEVMVTVGGCGAGKGYAIKNVPEVLAIKNGAKAVWDSAGDQNATENPWIQGELEKRGLKGTYVYVHADPYTSWAHPERGVVKRAGDPNDGRMVDAKVFADSYALGATNHHVFHRRNASNPNARFVFISNPPGKTLDGVPTEDLVLDRKKLASWAIDTVMKTDAPAHVKRGATIGTRIWSDDE